MKKFYALTLAVLQLGFVLAAHPSVDAQESKPSTAAKPKESADQESANQGPAAKPQDYSGMYTFLKEGEFVQVTVEDEGHVTGFVSRYGDQDSDRGAFLDQFFKTGKLEGNKLSFSTEVVHGESYEFKGAIERGQGKKPGDEAYYVLKGTLTEISTDVNKKISSRSREVVFKQFPQEAVPAPAKRD